MYIPPLNLSHLLRVHLERDWSPTLSPLPAPRRTVTETAETKAHIPGALSALINAEKDLALSSVRITELPSGTFEVAGQVGDLSGTRCPHCNGYWHTPDGECIDSPRQVRATSAAEQHRLEARAVVAAARVTTATECGSCHALPNQPHTEYCQIENREYPGQPGLRSDKAHDQGDACPTPCPWHGSPDR